MSLTQKAVRMALLLLLSILVWPLAAKAEVVFNDLNGRTVVLDRPAERIITIPIPHASICMAIDGGSSRVVGMHPSAKSALKEGILKKIFPEAELIRDDIVKSGFQPNVETLLNLNPDIVFQWGDKGNDDVDPLVNAGMKVGLVRFGTQRFIEDAILMYGKVLGKEDRAKEILGWHHETLKELTEQIKKIPMDQRPRVVYFYNYINGLKVGSGTTYQGFWMRTAGGVNPAENLKGHAPINTEQLMAWDPEVIILGGFESSLTPETLYDDPNLSSISAVKNHRVYKAPLGGYRWDPPSHESPLMWKWVAMLLYPDRFSWDLRKEIKEKYQFIYHYLPTEDEIDDIFRVPVNATGAYYNKFLRK